MDKFQMQLEDVLSRLDHPKWDDDEIFQDALGIIKELLSENGRLKDKVEDLRSEINEFQRLK